MAGKMLAITKFVSLEYSEEARQFLNERTKELREMSEAIERIWHNAHAWPERWFVPLPELIKLDKISRNILDILESD